MANKIDEILHGIRNMTVDNSSTENLIPLLNEIITADAATYENVDFVGDFLLILKESNDNVKTHLAKCIAEVTKNEPQRKRFTNKDIIGCLLGNLLDTFQTANRRALAIQLCRALGNLCYLNEAAPTLIHELKGDETLVNLFNATIDVDNAIDVQFAKVRGSLMSNYLLGGEELAKHAIDLNLMTKIQALIECSAENFTRNEPLLLTILPPLSILTENVSDLNFNGQLNMLLAKVLAASINPDLAEMCLELLNYQAENDDVKLLLAKEGLCETIYFLLDKYKMLANTSEARALMKLACDLIVLILTGDEAMHYLYTNPLLGHMEGWLDSSDVDLLTTGVLALGNFARTDSHCIDMVNKKVMNKLMEILAKNNGIDNDMRLQHALLSALRNLVILKPNKSAVIEAGLVQTILPMLEIHQSPVVYKLLGTLRMTVDGQDKLAMELLQNKTLIKQLVIWSKSSEYAEVTAESMRLMAWLIKHAYGKSSSDGGIRSSAEDEKSLREFIGTDGAVESMVNMLATHHFVMQNEALIALSILSTIFKNKKDLTSLSSNLNGGDNLDQLFIECDLGKKLSDFIAKGSDTMTKEIVENLQTFINLLRESSTVEAHLRKYNIEESLKLIPILVEYCTL